MARAGDTVENPVTGERIEFLRTAADTGGALLEMEDVWPRPGQRTPPHVHPEMEERWHVLSGRAGFQVGDAEERVAGPGETVVAPPGTPHRAWNASDGETRVRIEMRPALRWEEFVERLFRAAAEGRVDDTGAPEPELALELLREFRREVAPPP
ncbi:MAG TPA: cupin domain-containing protein [Thermoleophilaceae bacterium]|jgi:quercetin dioxygenase-like cupin family protein